MAKKKRTSKAGSGSSASDDAASAASTCTMASVCELPGTSGEDVDFVDEFERCLEALFEKRTSTRIAALANLVALLERTYSFEDCLYRQESMSRMLLASLRKGASSEASLALRALGLHIITLGCETETERNMPEVNLALQKTATAAGKDSGLRSLALEVLALLTFAVVEDEDECNKVTDGLFKIADSEGNPKVAAAALRGWSLMLTSLPPHQLDGAFCDRALQSLHARLATSDVDLRDAAGEATALVFTLAGLSGFEDEQPDSDHGEAEGGLQEVVQRMKDLATNRGDELRRSKKDRLFLKSSFRDHCKAVEGRQISFDKLKVRDGRTLVIDTLEGQLQLNAFRRFLGSALQPQMEANPLLQDIFGLASSSNGEIQQLHDLGYKVCRSATASQQKSRSKGRNREQSQKAFYAGSVLGAPDISVDNY